MDKNTKERQQCKKLAQLLGCLVAMNSRYDDDDSYWVYPPRGIYGLFGRPDPLEGDHLCVGWTEVWDALQTYSVDMAIAYATASPTKESVRLPPQGVDLWIV